MPKASRDQLRNLLGQHSNTIIFAGKHRVNGCAFEKHDKHRADFISVQKKGRVQ